MKGEQKIYIYTTHAEMYRLRLVDDSIKTVGI